MYLVNPYIIGNTGGGFTVPSSFIWEQVPNSPEYLITIAKSGSRLFAGTRSGLPTTYLGGVYYTDDGSTWHKFNAGLSARISICGDWPNPCSSAPTGGTFTLTYQGQTTSALSATASNAAIQAALEGLSTIGSGNVVLSDGPLGQSVTITFQGARANDDPTDITLNPVGLTGSTPGGMIRGPRLVTQLWTTPTGALLANVRNNTTTELFRLASGASTWVKASGLTGGAGIFFDYTDDANGNLLATNLVTTGNIKRSTDDGASWTNFATVDAPCTGDDSRPIGIYRATSSIAGTDVLFVSPHNDAVHYSTDNGATWTCIGIDPTVAYGGGSFIRVNASGQPMYGGEFGSFFVHTGAISASTWTYNVSGGYFTANAETVHDLIKLVNDDLIIHAKRPYRSTDGGATWTLDDSGLPTGTINNFDGGGSLSVASHTLVVGPDKKLYIAVVNQTSGWGIYRTTASVIP